MVADQALDIRALKDVLAKKRLRPAVKRQMVGEVMSSLSQRRACGLIGITRRSFRRVLGEDRNRLLRQRVRELAEERHRWGPTLYLLMRRKGFKANHKRVERLYREEGLSLHRRRRRKRLSHLRVMRSQPLSANQTWAADFIHDSLFNGRRFRAFAVLDEWSRESVAIEALGCWWRDCSKVRSSGFLCRADNAQERQCGPLAKAIRQQNGKSIIVELDLASQESISTAFVTVRREAGEPEVVVYNAGYMEGRELPPEKELLDHIPVEMFDTVQHISSRGPFLIAKEILPAMRMKGRGSFFFSNNANSLRGRKRMTGQSLYYPK